MFQDAKEELEEDIDFLSLDLWHKTLKEYYNKLVADGIFDQGSEEYTIL